MSSVQRVVNRLDRERLLPHLGRGDSGSTQAQYLRWLFENSKVVAPEKVPPYVVTMNSTVRLRDEHRDEEETFTLTYPGAVGEFGEAVSVLSPIGAALFGSQEGEHVRLVGSRAARSLVLEKIEFQPEREGKFDL